jgi:hypothetical protein
VETDKAVTVGLILCGYLRSWDAHPGMPTGAEMPKQPEGTCPRAQRACRLAATERLGCPPTDGYASSLRRATVSLI